MASAGGEVLRPVIEYAKWIRDVHRLCGAGVRQDRLRRSGRAQWRTARRSCGRSCALRRPTSPPEAGFAATGSSGSATAHMRSSFTGCSTSSSRTQSVGREPDRRPVAPQPVLSDSPPIPGWRQSSVARPRLPVRASVRRAGSNSSSSCDATRGGDRGANTDSCDRRRRPRAAEQGRCERPAPSAAGRAR